MELNEITFKVRTAIFAVFKELGPGLLESIYTSALEIELCSAGLRVEVESPGFTIKVMNLVWDSDWI
jgi:GxxExxY protein